MAKTYKIVRSFRHARGAETIKTGLSLAEARAHCRDPETSSSTCKYSPYIPGIEWFDGYDPD